MTFTNVLTQERKMKLFVRCIRTTSVLKQLYSLLHTTVSTMLQIFAGLKV